jgi:membrane AbrB-like protein
MAPSPAPGHAAGFRTIPFLVAVVLGTAGGAVFSWLSLPLPWMLGAMTAVTVAAIAGVDVAMPHWLRSSCITILGVMLGASFTPTVVARMGEWSVTLLALLVWATVNGGAGWWYFRRYARFDKVTAYFAASPGGLNEMTLVGGQMGGDERTISLVHATRVFITVFTIPIWFRLHDGLQSTATGRAFVGLFSVDLADYAVLGACAVVGAFGAARLGLPAAAVLGPMLLSAAVHLAGVTDSSPPTLIVFAAQVVIGTTLGCRFVGFPLGLAGRTIGHGAVVGFLMIAITVGFSVALAWITKLPLPAILLGFAPGGLAEMSLVAIALAVDAAFVATHHIVRIILVVTCAPLVFSWLGVRR